MVFRKQNGRGDFCGYFSSPEPKAHKVSILCTSSYLNNRTLPPFSSFFGVKCGVHLCCNTCCDYIQLISVELHLPGNYARNGHIYCNLIPRIPGISQYKPNPKINFCSFVIKIHFNQSNCNNHRKLNNITFSIVKIGSVLRILYDHLYMLIRADVPYLEFLIRGC